MPVKLAAHEKVTHVPTLQSTGRHMRLSACAASLSTTADRHARHAHATGGKRTVSGLTWKGRLEAVRGSAGRDAPDDAVKEEADPLSFGTGQEENSSPWKVDG